MIIHTNILVAPLLLIAWAIDIYVFLACLRLLLARFPGAAGVFQGLQAITDPLPLATGRMLNRRLTRPVSPWLPWLIVILGAVICRYLLISLVLLVP